MATISAIVAILALVSLSFMGVDYHSTSTASEPEPASGTEQYVVGYHKMGIPLESGDGFFGAEVLDVETALRFIVVEGPDDWSTDLVAMDPNVRYAEIDEPVYNTSFTPNGETTGYGAKQIGAPAAWNTTEGGSGTSAVCVIDTGVRYTHEDLMGARWKGGRDYVNNNDVFDDHGHGTHVQGIATAGINNSVGYTGIANVDFYHVKTLNDQGFGSSSNTAKSIRWCADNGPARTVINLSLGGGSSTPHKDAAEYAYFDWGALLVAAAGNDGCDDCIISPARLPTVIAVTCTNMDEEICGFSSRGPEAELAAPGLWVNNACYDDDTSYCAKSGTSMSSPHVAGAAALLWHENQALTNVQLRNCLQASAVNLGHPVPDVAAGYGRVDVGEAMDLCSTGGGPFPMGACFIVNPEKMGSVQDEWEVDASCSDLGNTTLQYRWSWEGDDQWTAWSSSPNATHQYNDEGVRSIYLEVKDDANETEQTLRPIVVNEPPEACMNVDYEEGGISRTFRVSGACSTDKLTITPKLDFRFDTNNDGTWDQNWTGGEWRAEVDFPKTGARTVKMQVSDQHGLVDETSIIVQVNLVDDNPTSDDVEFVTVSRSEYDKILYSYDGIDWSAALLTGNPWLWDVDHGDDKWIAVGESGIWSSSSGTIWSSVSGFWTLRGVKYANDTWMAVGKSGTIIKSSDGQTWNEQTSPTTSDLVNVEFGDGRWIAITAEGNVFGSDDNGATWSSLSSIDAWLNHCFKLTYTGTEWMASCGMNASGALHYSDQGENWTEVFYPHRSVTSVATDGNGHLAASGLGDTSQGLLGFGSSVNGGRWEARPGDPGDWQGYKDVVYNKNIDRWVSVGGGACSNNSWIVDSFDGYGWWPAGDGADQGCELFAVGARSLEDSGGGGGITVG